MTDSGAFEDFVKRYQSMVYGTAVRLIGDRGEAEDIAQTVFLRAFERFGSLRESPSAPGWLRTVTTNLCLNHLKRFRSRFRLFSQRRAAHGSEAAGFEELIADPESLDDHLEYRERIARLEQAVRRLPDRQRVPLVLFHFQQRSYREIAALLEVSLSKVKTDIHRGREALRRQLEAVDDSR